MKIEHLILSSSSSIDMNNNSLSVFGILDDMQVQVPAGVVFNLAFHAILIVKRVSESGPIHANFKMSVFAPSGERIGQELQLPVAMQAAHRRSRLRVMTEIPITHSGNYTVRLAHVENELLFHESSVHIQVMPVAVPQSPVQ